MDLEFHSDYNVTAIFGPGDYTPTTSVAGGGDAEYLSHPTGIYQYKAGRYAHLEIRPWSTTYWGGFSGDLNSFDTFHRLLMDGNKSVTYNLGTSGYELVVNQTGGAALIHPALSVILPEPRPPFTLSIQDLISSIDGLVNYPQG